MKVFETETKVNFIDENNVLVGYDLEPQCCECAGWFVAAKSMTVTPHETDIKTDYPGFVFDPKATPHSVDGEDNDLYMEIFRLTKGDEELFVHLYNCHNGYYSHGFEFKDGEKFIYDGSL